MVRMVAGATAELGRLRVIDGEGREGKARGNRG